MRADLFDVWLSFFFIFDEFGSADQFREALCQTAQRWTL
jgi:hypothetical protein